MPVQLVNGGNHLPFDVGSFDYLGTVAKAQFALVARKDVPFDDLEGLIAHAKAQGAPPV